MSSKNGLPLARVIEDLRRELMDAILLGAEQPLRFRLKPIELELQVAITDEVEGNAGIKFWVVELGGKGKLSGVETHSLKLVLEPVGAGPAGEILVSDTGLRD